MLNLHNSSSFVIQLASTPSDPYLEMAVSQNMAKVGEAMRAFATSGTTATANSAKPITRDNIIAAMEAMKSTIQEFEQRDAKYAKMFNDYYARKHGYDFDLGARMIINPNTPLAEVPQRYKQQVLSSVHVPVNELILAAAGIELNPDLCLRSVKPVQSSVFDPFAFEHERDI
jgi:hypothetical protein